MGGHMKTSKIIEYLHEILNRDDADQKAALKKILAKLKKKSRKLKAKLAEAKTDKERAEIEGKLKVNKAHREKGVEALRQLIGKE